MDSHAKAYEDLPHKPHGSRIINHIGGSIVGHEMPITSVEVEYIEEAIPETPVQDDVVGGSGDDGDSVDETDETPEAEKEIETQSGVTDIGPFLNVSDEDLVAAKELYEKETLVADEVKEIEQPVVKKKGIK
jgi:hypothetical protein